MTSRKSEKIHIISWWYPWMLTQVEHPSDWLTDAHKKVERERPLTTNMAVL